MSIQETSALLTQWGSSRLLCHRIDRSPFSMGRSSNNDLVLQDDKVSRRHAIIRRDTDGWVLEDCGSRHGTRLDGQEVQRPSCRGLRCHQQLQRQQPRRCEPGLANQRVCEPGFARDALGIDWNFALTDRLAMPEYDQCASSTGENRLEDLT